jgi:beta propeller repeat protein
MKKFDALILMVVAFMLIPTAKADYTINRFPVYEGAGDQTNPDIDVDTVVWQGSDSHIYWKSGDATPNVVNSGGTQTYPAVSNGVVVWYDSHTYNPGTGDTTQRDIYGYNLQSQGHLFITSNDDIKQWHPDISGNTIVYEHLGSAYNVYVYDIGSGLSEVIETASSHQIRPAVDGNLVVWGDARNDGYADFDIYMCDLSVKPYVAQAVSPSDGDQWEPAVSGRIIVWREDPGNGSGLNIYGYDLDDSATGVFQIFTTAGDQDYPAISGNIVAWQDQSRGAGNYDIWAIDLNDLAAGPFEVSDGTGDNQRPAVSGKTIVWQHNGDIWAAELLVPSTITVTSPNGGGVYLAGSEINFSWTHTGPVDEVLIEFSSNGGTDWAPVNTVENTGSYTWISFEDVDSANCLIRVTNTADGTATDTSDATFEIYQIPDSITVTDPNGGEQFLAGSEMDITWTSVGDVNDVKIELSDNDGADWQIVTLTTENDGAFTWDAVPADANSTQCIIHISDVADSSTWDISDTLFTVFQCDVDLTADLTGDCFVDIADFAELAAQWLSCGNLNDPTWCSQ